MSLVEQLRGIVATMPPGSSVSLPIDWLREQLDGSGGQGAAGNGEVEIDYSVKKVAELWGRRPGTVRDWIRSGRLEGYLFNRKEYRVTRLALERFLGDQRADSTRSRKDLTQRAPADLRAWRRIRIKPPAEP